MKAVSRSKVVARAVVVGAVLVLSVLRTGPAVADGSTTVVFGRVSAGSAHTCAVLDAGMVRCWGKGADGRLGYGAVDNVGDGVGPSIEVAGDVPVGGPVQAVTAGEAHTCALLTVGTVRCWGDGADDRLGYDDETDVGDGAGPSIEDAGDVLLPGPARSVAAGAAHTCAVLVTGGVSCWGAGSSPSVVDGVQDASAVAAGAGHTCVTTEAGGVLCWQVGSDPAAVSLVGGDPAVDVAVGESEACAVLGSGGVDCWDLDEAGAVGDPRVVSLAAPAVAVAAGGDRACALLDGGAVQCWAGGGSADGASITGGATGLTVGPEHACVLLGTELSCWGSGDDGRLGYGDSQARPAPAAAPPSATADAEDQSSPGEEVTFGGGTQAEAAGDAPQPGASEPDDSGPWWPWLATLAVPAAALGGWAVWRRRRRPGVTGP